MAIQDVTHEEAPRNKTTARRRLGSKITLDEMMEKLGERSASKGVRDHIGRRWVVDMSEQDSSEDSD